MTKVTEGKDGIKLFRREGLMRDFIYIGVHWFSGSSGKAEGSYVQSAPWPKDSKACHEPLETKPSSS